MKSKTYAQTLDYLYNRLPMFFRLGPAAYKKDLTNTLALCKALGEPHEKFKSIHIAGTNGKGSVSHFIASILQEAGYKAGLYTSPHLKDFRERIKINGQMIPEEQVISFVANNTTLIENLEPSFFEVTVAMAFAYFAEEEVDFVVLETGLGGRLDSTNVVTPVLSIITNVTYDHQNMLGNSLAEIAAEKAGIVKRGVPVVVGQVHSEAMEVIERAAADKGSSLINSAQNYQIISSSMEKGFLTLCIRKKLDVSDIHLKSPLAGYYQFENIITVLQAIEKLRKQGLSISDTDIIQGIQKVKENTGLRGRWEVLSESPLVICDVAHNEAGLKAVLEQVHSLSHGKLHIVYGMVQDKEIHKALGLLPKSAMYYFCAPALPRALPVELLNAAASKAGLKFHSFASVTEALKMAKTNASRNDVILVTGSIFVVAEVL